MGAERDGVPICPGNRFANGLGSFGLDQDTRYKRHAQVKHQPVLRDRISAWDQDFAVGGIDDSSQFINRIGGDSNGWVGVMRRKALRDKPAWARVF